MSFFEIPFFCDFPLSYIKTISLFTVLFRKDILLLMIYPYDIKTPTHHSSRKFLKITYNDNCFDTHVFKTRYPTKHNFIKPKRFFYWIFGISPKHLVLIYFEVVRRESIFKSFIPRGLLSIDDNDEREKVSLKEIEFKSSVPKSNHRKCLINLFVFL